MSTSTRIPRLKVTESLARRDGQQEGQDDEESPLWPEVADDLGLCTICFSWGPCDCQGD